MKQDPDLAAAMKELRYKARRLRQLQTMLAEPESSVTYQRMLSVQSELADLHETFAMKGEKLCMDPDRRLAGRALLLVTEEADRLETRHKRRPTFLILLEGMRVAEERLAIVANEAAAEARMAEFARKGAAVNAAAQSSAVRYLDASR